MSELVKRARRLALARGMVRRPSTARPTGLVWGSPEGPEIEQADLPDGEYLVTDFVVYDPRGDDPALAVSRDRVSADPEERGRVFAHDGRVIGSVTRTRRGAMLLEYAWPEGLAPAELPPAKAAG